MLHHKLWIDAQGRRVSWFTAVAPPLLLLFLSLVAGELGYWITRSPTSDYNNAHAGIIHFSFFIFSDLLLARKEAPSLYGNCDQVAETLGIPKPRMVFHSAEPVGATAGVGLPLAFRSDQNFRIKLVSALLFHNYLRTEYDTKKIRVAFIIIPLMFFFAGLWRGIGFDTLLRYAGLCVIWLVCIVGILAFPLRYLVRPQTDFEQEATELVKKRWPVVD
jgi:hypothetical protein